MNRRRLISLCDLSQFSSQRTTTSSHRMFSETKRNVTTQVSRCIISALKGCYFSPIAGTSKPLEANIFLATKHRSHNHVLFIGTPKLIVVDFSPPALKTRHARNSLYTDETKNEQEGRRQSGNGTMRAAVRTRVSTRSVAWAIPAPLFRSVVFRVALFLTAEIYICRQGRPLFLPIGLIVRGDDRD